MIGCERTAVAVRSTDWLDLIVILTGCRLTKNRRISTRDDRQILFVDLKLANHANVSMCQFSVCDGHLTMQGVTAGTEVLSQPHNPLEIMAIDGAAQGIGGSGIGEALFRPTFQIVHRLALVETVEINLMHGRARGFDANHLLALVQVTLEFKSVINQL